MESCGSGHGGSSTDLHVHRKGALPPLPQGSALGGDMAIARIDEQTEEIEELQRYTRVLEVQLADTVVDGEELVALRQRVRQLEKIAWAEGTSQAEGAQPWWSVFQ